MPQLGVTLDLKQPVGCARLGIEEEGGRVDARRAGVVGRWCRLRQQLSVPTNADGNGATEWSVQVPANVPIGPVFFQTLKFGSVSNMVKAESLRREF